MAPLPTNRRTSTFERRVGRALESALPEGSDAGAPVLVACSGGPDSTAALVAVARARAASGAGPTIAANFDHGLRGNAGSEEAAFVCALASSVGAGFVRGARPSRQRASRSEASAREARYRWLARAAREAGASAVVTGHTLDDQAETVILRLTRGTGLAGAAGMSARAPWPVAGGRGLTVVRPLLDESRLDVERYLEALGVRAQLDASNADLEFARNRVRHRVLPELRAVNPRAAQAIARFATLAARDAATLEEQARIELAHIARRLDRDTIALDRRALRALPAAIASRVVRQAAGDLGLALEAEQVERALRAAARRGQALHLEGGEVTSEGPNVLIQRTGREKA